MNDARARAYRLTATLIDAWKGDGRSLATDRELETEVVKIRDAMLAAAENRARGPVDRTEPQRAKGDPLDPLPPEPKVINALPQMPVPPCPRCGASLPAEQVHEHVCARGGK